MRRRHVRSDRQHRETKQLHAPQTTLDKCGPSVRRGLQNAARDAPERTARCALRELTPSRATHPPTLPRRPTEPCNVVQPSARQWGTRGR
eukprot:7220153-Prymnesium_polylepis.1